MQHLPKYYKWIFFFVLLAASSIAVPVLADYLGPNRTVTWTDSVCHVVLYKCTKKDGQWKYRRDEDWLCSSESKPWKAYPSNSRPCGESQNEGYQYWEEEQQSDVVTIIHPPATIAGSIENCSLQNGWCRSGAAPQLALSASEPLAGYSILLIEGTLNGAIFSCSNGATSCSISLNEGDNNFSYWALSSWGDSSAMGTSAARVDTVPPDVGLDISGASGLNGWYVSPTTVTATGSDATSGVASTLLSTDNVTWQPSMILNEGVYAVAVTVLDNAGNQSDSSTTILVDTTTPSIVVSVSGTAGNNGWYKSSVQVSAVPDDATSGIAMFEVSADGAAYQSYTSIVFNDGHHTIRFRAIDNAGNQTETPLQEFYVDTNAPTVDLPSSWQLGRNVPYDARDEGSGLAALRIVIEDEDERYAKVAWNEEVSGPTYSQDIDWNGEFKDKTVAPPGTYLVWIKVSDRAGNERFHLGKVIVPEPNVFLSLLPTEEPSAALPTPPAELSETDDATSLTTPPALDFGGETTEPAEITTHSLLLTSGTAGATTTPSSSGVLWGAAAAAAIAAATAYALEATRKRKEAEAEQAAQVEQEIARDKEKRAEKKQKQQENWKKQQALLLQQEREQQAISNARMEKKMAQLDAQDEASWVASQVAIRKRAEAKKKAEEESRKIEELQTKLAGYYNAEKQGATGVVTSPEEKSWWQRTWEGTQNARDKAWLWVDQHQTEIALGIGILAGVAVIILSGGVAAPMVAAALVAGTAAIAAGTVAAGTVILNAHYEREWHENLLKNTALSGLAALAVAGGWFLFQAATTAIGPYCYTHQAICGRVEPVLNALDWGEEAWLSTKLGFQTLMGNDVGAAETALELQTEHMDGGMPGNAVAKELGGETIEKVSKYGDEALDLVKLYGIDAAQIIFTYGDDGIAILQKYGNDAIGLIKSHGELAIKVMDVVDPRHAKNLLKTLDDDVLEYAMQQGPDAVDALSRWSTKDLSGHGAELALRAKNDAKVLADVKKLVALRPIDPKHLTEEQQVLIDTIAANSTHYSEEGQVVLGKWIDYGSGFIEYAKDTGSLHYSPHPDVWNMLGDLGEGNQGEVAWLVNRQVVQTGIDKGLPFEYTLNDIPTKDITREGDAIQALFAGATDVEIMRILRSGYMPIRMKELQELQKAGYEFAFDEINNSYIFILP